MSSPLRFFFIFIGLVLAVAVARSSQGAALSLSPEVSASQAFNGHYVWPTAEKREVYGWNDCEFSPLSCLLRKRRSIDRMFEQ
ncbi:unnamed protein product [Auanema sp. JU1783]|nr:unnamed protein product [Auanema sp. JU1783]